MSRNKIEPGTPCSRGHAYERRGPHGCRACKYERRRRTTERKSHRKRAAYLEAAGVAWIAAAQNSLKKRSRGKPRASRRELFGLWLSQRGRCGLTGLLIEGVPHLDHKVPVADGGVSTVDNLHWTHPIANMAKNSHSVDEFRAWLLAAADSLKAKMEFEALL